MMSIDISARGVNVVCGKCQGRGEVVQFDEVGGVGFDTCPACDGVGMMPPEEMVRFRPNEIEDVIASLRQTSDMLTVTAGKLEAQFRREGGGEVKALKQ